jgi:hypothetical protein
MRRAVHTFLLFTLAVICESAAAVSPLVAEGTSAPSLRTAAPKPAFEALVTIGTNPAVAGSSIHQPFERTAAWPFSKSNRRPIYNAFPSPVTPHPAVARIVVPEKSATAFGSGTLVDVRDQYGLVVTNWHVVCDSQGVVDVVFPNGFRSHARPLKVDSDWDLAALVIWRPPIEPVKLATQPPRPGQLLTIHGYGQGQYRIATGRCTTYYAPRENFPQEMVELDVEARQGDSGGPIFNERGELAGVLFGAGQGTTLGSFAPRVSCFLATLAPDIGQANDQALVAVAERPAPNVQQPGNQSEYPSSPWSPSDATRDRLAEATRPSNIAYFPDGLVGPETSRNPHQNRSAASESPLSWHDIAAAGWYDPAKSALAVVGLAAIALRLVKTVR